jgi:23S rRNA pseudouridine1911/1915/1917 synthase
LARLEFKHTVLADDTGRVDVLVARLIKFSRSRVRGLIDHGGAWINDLPVSDAGTLVASGDRLLLRYDSERRYKEKSAPRPTRGFSVVYSDEHLIVVDKESGILTVPTERRETNTLVDLIAGHLSQGQRHSAKLGVVHRLDRDTSGLLVFGRSAAVTAHLITQFAARKPEREYVAIVAGTVVKDSGERRSHLQTDSALNQKSAAVGELAITHFNVRRRFKDTTLVGLRLETGRRNQIRVHMAEMGHPVLGDQRYRAGQAAHKDWQYKRLALHARSLGFVHPVTNQMLRFEAPIPAAFTRFESSQR